MRAGLDHIIRLDYLDFNFKHLKDFASNELIFMVKANAYGHGLEDIALFAQNELDVKNFGVASIGEGVKLSQILTDDVRVFIFSDTGLLFEEGRDKIASHKVIPVLSSLEELKIFFKDSRFKHYPFVLKVNTGMNRLGLDEWEMEEVIAQIKLAGRKSITHLMGHFSQSYFEVQTGDSTQQQLKKFQNYKKVFTDHGIEINETSHANSGAIEQKLALTETHIRPGLMLYGPPSVGVLKKQKRLWKGKLISHLKTNIIHMRKLKKGDSIGYGNSKLTEDAMIAFLPLGYGDGFLTYYTGQEISSSLGTLKIFGRINMDITQVILPKGSKARVGDEVTFFNDIEEFLSFCKATQSISYQVLTSLSSRVPRSYLL